MISEHSVCVGLWMGVIAGTPPSSMMSLMPRCSHTIQVRGSASCSYRASGIMRFGRHCSRVVRLSSFFAHANRRWQMDIAFVAASTVGRLHWRILGYYGLPKMTLTGLVGGLMNELWTLVAFWSGEGSWQILHWVGMPQMEHSIAMMYARRVVAPLSCAVFIQAARRFSGWPCRPQHILSPYTIEEQKLSVMHTISASEALLSWPIRAAGFREVFGSIAALLSTKCRRSLEMFEDMAKFTTSPVENEHRGVGDPAASTTTGSAIAPLCHRTVCRHLQSAHLLTGSGGISFPMGRKRLPECNADPTLAFLPALAERAHVMPVEDAQLVVAEAPVDSGGMKVEDLGGGNPKVCYLDWRLSMLKQQRGGLTREPTPEARAASVQPCDSDQNWKRTWANIFA